MENFSEPEREELDEERTVGRTRLLVYLVGWFLYLPLSSLFGWVRWFPAGRAYAPGAILSTILYLIGFCLAVHILVVWPIATLAYPQLRSFMSRWKRILVASALQALPLVSFGWYLGAGHGSESTLSLVLTILPVAVLGSVLLEVAEAAWIGTAVLTAGAFVPFFVVNDVMDGMPVILNFAAMDPIFYFWRSLWPVACVAGAACLELGLPRERASLAWLTMLNALFAMILFAGELLPRDISAIVFAPTLLFVWHARSHARALALTAAIALAATSLFWLGWYATHARYEFWFLMRVACQTTSFIVSGLWIARFLPKLPATTSMLRSPDSTAKSVP